MITPETLEMVERWMGNVSFNLFMRQVHLDLHVGLKNGVPVEIAKAALHNLCKVIEESVNWTPIQPTNKKEFVELKPDAYLLARALSRTR